MTRMFAATDTDFAPWLVAPSNRKRNVRLNIISDILKRVPYKDVPREKLALPKAPEGGRLRRAGLSAQIHRATLLMPRFTRAAIGRLRICRLKLGNP